MHATRRRFAAAAAAMAVMAALTTPASAGTGGTSITVRTAHMDSVEIFGFADGADVTISFTDPDGGPTCPDFVIESPQTEGGGPGCDMQAGWIVTASDGVNEAELLIQDLQIVDFDLDADTVTVWVDDLDDSLEFGCDGGVSIGINDGVSELGSRAVMAEGLTVIDFGSPGPCADPFDDDTVDLTGQPQELVMGAEDADGDRTGDLRSLASTRFACPTGDTPFTDVSMTSFAYDDVKCIYGLEITTGTSPTTYSPADFVTREQMASFLARLFRVSRGPYGAEHPFTDVDGGSFAYDDIGTIYALGVTTGTSPTTYSPGDFVTREQMASFLARMYAVAYGSIDGPVHALVVDTPFTDMVQASDYAKDDIARLYGLEITTGTTATTYSPKDLVTREQMAAFLARLLRAIHLVRDLS